MKKIKTYIYILIISVICWNCTAMNSSVFAPNGVYNDKDEETVLVSDAANNKVLRLSKDGETITSSSKFSGKINDLIIVEDKLIVLTGGFNGEIVSLDIENLKELDRKIVGHTPSSIILDNGKGVYWITLRHENALIAIDQKNGNEIKRLNIGREPMDIIGFKGNKLLVACNLPEQSSLSFPIASALKVLDTKNGEIMKDIMLPNGSTDIKSITTDKSGNYAYVTHLLARYQLPTNQVDRGWMSTNAMSIIDLNNNRLLSTVLLDTPQRGAANPWQVIVSNDNKNIVVALSGTHEILTIDRESLHNRINQYKEGIASIPSSKDSSDIVNDASFLHGIRRFIPTKGNGSRTLVQVGAKIYVANYFSGDIVQFNANASVESIEAEPLMSGKMSLADTKIGKGEMYFHDAQLCFQQWQSCASCHPNDARTDGLNWDLLNDGMGNPKNTKSLLYSLQTPPSMITGIRANAEIAVDAGFKHILFAKVDEEVPQYVNLYLMNLRPGQSPYLAKDGKLSESALRGKPLFDKYCLQCHTGEYYTDQKQYKVEWSNKKETNQTMDVTSLIEIWRTSPYLYDGRAYTMKEMLNIHSPSEQLSQSALDGLEMYILSL